MEVLESVCCLGVTNDGQIFRMRNGAWADAQYQIGDKFKISDSSPASGDWAIAPDGKKIWIDQDERQCFRELENA